MVLFLLVKIQRNKVFKKEKHQSQIFVSNSFIPFYPAYYSNPLVDLKFRDPAKSKIKYQNLS